MYRLPIYPHEWLRVEETFRVKWHVPHALWAIDGKHVAIKCPSHTGTRYYNYKGFYSIIMLALVDADYKYLWLDVGANGGCSDAQLRFKTTTRGWIHRLPTTGTNT